MFSSLTTNVTSQRVGDVLLGAGILGGIYVGIRKNNGIMPVLGWGLVFGLAGAFAGFVYTSVAGGAKS